MAGVFTPRANFIARASIVAVLLAVTSIAGIAAAYIHSSFYTGVGIEINQPVPFSHQHHVGGLGIDCRYCHTAVENSPFAGMPTTQTCMNCHAKLWTDAPLLEPIRTSWTKGRPVKWQRVHDLPDHVFFDHSIHLSKGIGCSTCHGRVDLMPLVHKVESLHMRWCLDCHRDPAPYIRPKDQIFNMEWRPKEIASESKREDVHLNLPSTLTDCSACHR